MPVQGVPVKREALVSGRRKGTWSSWNSAGENQASFGCCTMMSLLASRVHLLVQLLADSSSSQVHTGGRRLGTLRYVSM